METDQDRETMPLEEFSVGDFRREDAPGLVRLFHAVYGSGYPIAHFYDPAALTAANEEGRCYSIVARTTSGRIVGAWHLSRTAPYASLYEAGAGLVLKEYRNRGINNQLSAYISSEFVFRKPNIEEIFGEPVCNHIATQKSVVSERYVVTALEVALMPAETYSKEKSATGRVATLMAFRCYRPKPHRIYLPACYAEELRSIYARLDDGRELTISAGKTPGDRKTRAEMTVFDFARVARIAIHEAGHDFEPCLAELERKAREQRVVVFQVWVNLAHPWTGETVESLRRMGYFLGGALPRWFDDDGMLMQKLLCPPDFDFIHLYTEESKDLLETVKREWQRAETRR
ncbi:MAG: hypothetical protein LLG97_19855 [Deltaproteobacteria bacterium]|nr:hypothetical protein [Deltaproteobacteria bacterium]